MKEKKNMMAVDRILRHSIKKAYKVQSKDSIDTSELVWYGKKMFELFHVNPIKRVRLIEYIVGVKDKR